jgi:hypothetical protein
MSITHPLHHVASIGTPLYLFAVLMVFYFFPIASVRSFAAAIIHIINFVGHLVVTLGTTYSWRVDSTGTLRFHPIHILSYPIISYGGLT